MIIVSNTSGGIKNVILINSEGLTFKYKSRIEQFFTWEEITNIFPWRRFNAMTVIGQNNKVATGWVMGDREHGNSWKKMDYIYRTWEERLKQTGMRGYFEYPPWCKEKENQLHLQNIIWGIGGGLLINLMVFVALQENGWRVLNLKEDWPIIAALVFGIYALIFGVNSVIARNRKSAVEATLEEDVLEVIFEDGMIKQCNLANVRKHNLSKHYYKGMVISKDGLKFEHLERLSYWPILRELLLEKLENKE